MRHLPWPRCWLSLSAHFWLLRRLRIASSATGLLRRRHFPGESLAALDRPGFFRGYDGPMEATVKGKGFLFLDGEYLPPPYEIRYAEDKLTVNGRELTCIPPPRSFGGRGFGSSRGGEPSWRHMVNELSSHLMGDSVVLSFEGSRTTVSMSMRPMNFWDRCGAGKAVDTPGDREGAPARRVR